MRKLLLFCNLIFMFCTPYVGAQDMHAFYKKASKINKAIVWNDLAALIYEKHGDATILKEATDNAIQLAKASNDSAQWGRAMIFSSDFLYQKGYFKAYQESLIKGYELLKNSDLYEMKEMALNNIGTAFAEMDQLDSMYIYVRKAIDLNQKYQGKAKRLGEEYQNLSYLFSITGKADSAYYYIQHTIEAFTSAQDTIGLLDAYNQMAVYYIKRNQYPEAVEYFDKSLKLYEGLENKHNRLYIYSNLAGLYFRWDKTNKAILFARKALEDAKDTQEKATYGKLLSNLGTFLYHNKEYRSSIDTLRTALPLVKESVHYYGSVLQMLTNCYEMINKPDSCEYFLDKVDHLAESGQFIRNELFYAAKIGLLVDQDEFEKAVPLARDFIKKDKTKELTECSPHIYNNIALVLEKGAKDYKTALEYKTKAASMQDSIYQKEAREQLSDFYAKYKTADKDLKIAAMKIEQQRIQHNRAVYIGITAFIFVVLIIWILFMILSKIKKEKEAIDLRARIKEKESEFLLMEAQSHNNVLKSYFNGLEAGRKKLAKELHDNIANELFGVNMMLKMQGNVKEETLKEIDRLYSEIRAVSHDLMPPVFSQASFSEILEDHTMRMNMKGNTCFELFVANEEELNKLDEDVSLAVYRIVQETTSNILKYAKAASATIDIRLDAGQLHLMIADNGVGFDLHKKIKGIGLMTMKERVNGLKGQMSIVTQPGDGCRIDIVIPIS